MSEKEQTVKAELATVTERAIAGIIDWGIGVVVMFLIELIPSIFSWIQSAAITRAFNQYLNDFDYVAYLNAVERVAWMGLVATLLYLFMSLLGIVFVLGYFVWWPTRHEGQTFGKKFQKIQVAIIEDEAKGKIRVMDKQDLVPALIRWLQNS